MVHGSEYETFVQLHKQQLESSDVPQCYWEQLHRKLCNQIFDAGSAMSLLQIDYENETKDEYDPIWHIQVKTKGGIKAGSPQEIYLIDHAWTFRTENARKQLTEIDSLRERMAAIMGLGCESQKEIVVNHIFEEMWKYCNCYSFGNATSVEDRVPVWYIMDEVGSAIKHSDSPNFRVVPFIYIPEQITYSLMFPIRDAQYGELVSRNFAEGITDEGIRHALLLPWVPHSFLDVDFTQTEPSPDYFLSGHTEETLPILAKLRNSQPIKQKYKVFAEYKYIHKYLTSPRFELVNDETDADILWYTRHFKNFEEFSNTPEKFINQFPFEYILTIKDLLSVVCRRKAKTPVWLPTTYNLITELTKFVSCYQHREKQGLDNHWIIKPFNLARGLDTHVTKNLKYILRLPLTGPKIAQKYIENPVLFYRPDCCGKVKFDVRYVILLKSVKPLEVYIYKNFFLRFANKAFELNDFDDYEKHFTVMNYTETANLKHIKCSEFKDQWKQQYPLIPWSSVEAVTCQMLREVFDFATVTDPPCGISQSPQSRALYAVDIMLEWTEKSEVQPKLLEINWTPDCKRACNYYPDFYNDIFALLFLNEENGDIFQAL